MFTASPRGRYTVTAVLRSLRSTTKCEMPEIRTGAVPVTFWISAAVAVQLTTAHRVPQKS